MERIGPYELLEPLGRGGMGVVYRARHTERGSMVALKTVLLPNAAMLQSLRREIHALARLRHPGVVRIVDEGLESGVPWYAMELLEGRTLRQYSTELLQQAAATLETSDGVSALVRPTLTLGAVGRRLADGSAEAPVPPSSSTKTGEAAVMPAAGGALTEVLGLVQHLCEVLAFLHGEGLLHRDLKPENIFLRAASGERRAASEQQAAVPVLAARSSQLAAYPVLVDFGLAVRLSGQLGRETLEVSRTQIGTLAYMAPEQIQGAALDARADLYALGCILYELVTGRRPFVRPTVQQLVRAHLSEPPEPASQLVEGVPPELDELLLRLLAKQPRERPGHASHVAAALARMGAPSAGLVSDAPRPRAYLYRPGFAGREPLLLELERQLESLETGAGQIVLVAGESGSGKTRLLMELAAVAERGGVRALAGEGQPTVEAAPGEGGAALHPLRPLLRFVADHCRERGEAETERLLGRRGRLLALYEPALEGLPGLERHPEPAELPAPAAYLRLYHDLAETFAALCTAAPLSAAPEPAGAELLLLLDDLQWADELTLGFLGYLLRTGRLARMPLLVVAAYRPEELDPPKPGPLRKLVESPAAVRHALARLDEADVSSIVRDMLGVSAAPAALSRFLARRSAGNPFFVAEYLRAAVDAGLLDRDERGEWRLAREAAAPELDDGQDGLALPRSLQELLGSRLRGLSHGAAALTGALAILGRDGDATLAARIGGLPERSALEASAELLRRHVLEEPEPQRLRFVHEQLRELTLASLEPEARRDLHVAAAAALEEGVQDGQGDRLAAVAWQWEQAAGGEPRAAASAGPPEALDRARRFYLAAARQAVRRYAHAEAERLYRAFFRLLDRATPESIAARAELGYSVLRFQGRVSEAGAELESSVAGARQLGDRGAEALYLRQLGILLGETGRYAEAQDIFAQALGIIRQSGSSQMEGKTLSSLAVVLWEQGRISEAQGLYEQALQISRETGDREGEASALGNLGIVLHELARVDEAARCFEQAIELHRLDERRPSAGITLGNLGILRAEQGHGNAARRLFEEALAIHQEVGSRRFEGVTTYNLGLVHHFDGQPAAARVMFERALVLARETGNRRDEALCLRSLAVLDAEAGDDERARRSFGQAVAIVEQTGARQTEAEILIVWAGMERRVGALDEAERLLSRAETLLSELAAPAAGALALCQRAHLMLAQEQVAGFLLETARRRAAQLGRSAFTDLGRALAALERAVEAFEAGRPLRWGECAGDVPEALRGRD
jgi:serine/threonine protein kinase/predicted ATPase